MDKVDKEILKILLQEEEEDDEILLLHLSEEKRKQHDPLFTKRSTEGYHEILINGHLKNNEIKFREFFRLNRNQFDFILNLVTDDLTLNPTFFIRKPISPEEKLAVTLR
ncbi:protein ANTAGONIST OF LIKE HETEROCHROMATIN PROTEIN 1-like [Aphis craccivora]|uniref:Protein ANTAGONIST OF LIKE HETEROCHROMATIN PROTEIN 1-like n=1 Tax=Aphis craccivora TaxID=307492 RepID=A0A6G0W0V2_APHCR|nr:protein ANTAGONIST OF LIKE HETEROCHROMATIN PROTEIN 1-like [Aphis craccivora]